MGHSIQGFVGHAAVLGQIAAPLKSTIHTAELPQDFRLLFFTGDMLDEIQQRLENTVADPIKPFFYWDTLTVQYLRAHPPMGDCIYLETDYFGGEGEQHAIFLSDGHPVQYYTQQNIVAGQNYPHSMLQQPINTALKRLGVSRLPELDEFDTLELGRFRRMP